MKKHLFIVAISLLIIIASACSSNSTNKKFGNSPFENVSLNMYKDDTIESFGEPDSSNHDNGAYYHYVFMGLDGNITLIFNEKTKKMSEALWVTSIKNKTAIECKKKIDKILEFYDKEIGDDKGQKSSNHSHLYWWDYYTGHGTRLMLEVIESESKESDLKLTTLRLILQNKDK